MQGTIIGYNAVFQVVPIYHRLTLILIKKILSNFLPSFFTPKYLILFKSQISPSYKAYLLVSVCPN